MLDTDSLFIAALKGNAELMVLLGGEEPTPEPDTPSLPPPNGGGEEDENEPTTTDPSSQEEGSDPTPAPSDPTPSPSPNGEGGDEEGSSKEARLYGTAIPLPDDDAENVEVPYVIVTFDGLTNVEESKDVPYEGDEDRVNIGVEVTAKTLKDLHDLTQMVRETILGYFQENETAVRDYQMSADGIQYDAKKPCYWQVLRYVCDVEPLNIDENE